MKSKTTTRMPRARMFLSLILFLVMSTSEFLNAQAVIQTPNTPYNGNQSSSGRNFVTFIIENTNNVPYTLNEITTMVRSGTITPTFSFSPDSNAVYKLYYSTNLSGPGIIPGVGAFFNEFTHIATSANNPVTA